MVVPPKVVVTAVGEEEEAVMAEGEGAVVAERGTGEFFLKLKSFHRRGVNKIVGVDVCGVVGYRKA